MTKATKRFGLKLGALLLLGAAAGRADAAGNVVVLGQDPSFHWQYNEGQSLQLGGQAAQYADGGSLSNPILAVADGSFGENLPGMLTAFGFTSVTTIDPTQLAATDLSAYKAVYFGPTTQQSTIDTYDANTAKIEAFIAAGGGVVAEPEYGTSGFFGFLPGGSLLGYNSNPAGGGEDVHIINGTNPVTAGLTDAGLSGWGESIHNDFTSPGAAGYTTLTVNADSGNGVDLVMPGTTSSVPEIDPASATSALACLSSGLLMLTRRRRSRSDA